MLKLYRYRILFRIAIAMVICCLIFAFLLDMRLVTDKSMSRFDRFLKFQHTSKKIKTIFPVKSSELILANNAVDKAVAKLILSPTEEKHIQKNIQSNETVESLNFIPNVVPVNDRDLPNDEMPDNPFVYIQKVKDLKKAAMELIKKQENREIPRDDKSDHFPKLFKMLQDLHPKKNAPENDTKMFFDLSQDAVESGNIGPFPEKKIISKTLQSYETMETSESAKSKIQRMADISIEDNTNNLSHVQKYYTKLRLSESEINEIKSAIAQRNEAQLVANTDLYGPVTAQTTIVLVQVSNLWPGHRQDNNRTGPGK